MKTKLKILPALLFTALLFTGMLPSQATFASAGTQITAANEMVSGETTSTTIAVWNTDTAEHTYTLTYDYLPADFHGYFMQNNTVTDTVTIPASESAVLAFLVDVPADTTTKELHISLNAVKEDGTANTFPVTYTLNNEYGVVISNNVTLIKATNGDTITLDIGVTNTGTRDLSGLALSVDAPYKWITENITPENISLKAGETGVYKVSLIIPTSGQAGEYPVKLTCSNDQVTSSELVASVAVSTSVQYFWWIAGVVAVVLVFTLLYFKKHGRR